MLSGKHAWLFKFKLQPLRSDGAYYQIKKRGKALRYGVTSRLPEAVDSFIISLVGDIS